MSPEPVRVTGEVLSVKKVGAHHLLTVVAPGVAEQFRPGTLVALGVGGPLSDRVVPVVVPIHRVRPTGAYGGTVEVLLADGDPAVAWLTQAPAGTRLPVTGPLGRPFALPKEPVTCVLVLKPTRNESNPGMPIPPLTPSDVQRP